jgi:hypothetical protein
MLGSVLHALGYVWALPNTILGLFLGLLSFQPPRLDSGVLVFDRTRRGFLWAFGLSRWRAITLGHVVLATQKLEGSLRAHEFVHVRQHARLGLLFLPAYVALHVFTGYRQNPFEAAALREEEDQRVRTAPPP